MNDAAIRRLVRQQLESLAAAGVGQVGRGVAPNPRAEPQTGPKTGLQTESQTGPLGKPAVAADAAATADPPSVDAPPLPLTILSDEVAACTRCDELASTRTQTVFGVGNPQARLCFLGEAPGADEDRTGEPFVGKAGQLLNKILSACTLSRDDVYILNILKCRPPGNRNPTLLESDNCRGFLTRQLELIEPEFICCLGAVAAQNLLDTTESIGRLRGRVHTYRGINVVCTYHPAYLLRNPSAKRDAWEDMKFLMRGLGVEL